MFIIEFYNGYSVYMNREEVNAIKLLYFLERYSKKFINICSIKYNNKELDVDSIVEQLKFDQIILLSERFLLSLYS